MKIVSIVGARPQFVKAAVVSREFRKIPGAREVLVHTGQHYDANMSDWFFEELDIPRPDHHLGVAGLGHGPMTGRMMESLETLLIQERPDAVLVYGDTNSTLAGAVTGVKMHIPVAHVEAGLRSFNRAMPEEVNRVVTDHVSSVLFCPTRAAVENLVREGHPPAGDPGRAGALQQPFRDRKVFLVGDVMLDACLYYRAKAQAASRVLETLSLAPREYCLATVHRAENTDDPCRLESIVRAFKDLARETPVVFPVHPRTRHVLERTGLLEDRPGNLRLIEPVGYLDMTRLEAEARVILTDSGGVQKEACIHGVPCVTLREETEWVELVEAGINTLAGADSGRILAAVEAAPACGHDFGERFYGDGEAGRHIAELLDRVLGPEAIS